ncbi:hypothetical protein DPEC_G00040210 [Dallia pectoralis]|uniref:Uncharacterized protein n=1 Tax=Dallia pectoralis TaxID=75939 RepID=A0ACC2HF34_DALPE|nr:hypothetical protein DPEC_G00040210 [Dallia pectoralis]
MIDSLSEAMEWVLKHPERNRVTTTENHTAHKDLRHGFLGKGNAADKYVDQAVDGAAKAAKQKVKTMLSGADGKKPASGATEAKPVAEGDSSKKPSSGGSGGADVKPVAGEPKNPSSGGISGGIGGGAASVNVGGGDFDLTDTLGDLAKEMSGEK